MKTSTTPEFASPENRPIRLAGSTLGHNAHVCAFFKSCADQYRVLAPFIKDGLESGQKAVLTIDTKQHQEHLRHLKASGIDFESKCQQGQLEVRYWHDTHLRENQWNPAKTLALFAELANNAKQEGFPLSRFVTQMEWALENGMDANDLLEYEARANEIWMGQKGPVNPVICAYDLTQFSAEVVIDAMRTHPMVIIGGILQENPFFVPHDELLEQLRDRRPSPLRRVG